MPYIAFILHADWLIHPRLQGIVWRHFETLQEQIDDRFGPNYVPLPVDRGWWEGYTREANRSTWLQASAHSPLYDNTDQVSCAPANLYHASLPPNQLTLHMSPIS